MRVLPRFIASLMGLCLWLAVVPAEAWVETRLVTDEVRVEVDPSASAVVDHRITMRVHGGPLKSFDLASADKDVTPLESTVAAAGAETAAPAAIPLELVPRAAGGLRVNVTAPRGLSRGVFVFRIRYRRALLAGEDIRRDGAMLRLRWTGASWPDGRDNVGCTFLLPSAPTEPRAPGGPGRSDRGDSLESSDGVFIAEIKRAADHDEVSLVRPHVARAEAVTWTVYVDPRALGEVNDPGLRPTPPPRDPRARVPAQQRAAYAGAAAFLLFGFSLLVGIKARQVARHAEGVAMPRPLVPLPTSLRVLLAGPALAGGAALQLRLDDPRWGSLAVLAALALAAYRRPLWQRAPRGPGRWLLLADGEAFADPEPARGAWLDAGTITGRVLFLGALSVAALVAYSVGRASAYHGYLVGFDATVLFAVFGTGRLADLPPHPIAGAGPRLGRIAQKLRTRAGMRAVAWARLPDGGGAFDELRLLCAPKVPLRGFVGIEVGLVSLMGAGGSLYLPELLVRVIDASPCHDAFRKLRPGARWLRGRRAEERVMSLAPRLPTLAMAAALAIRLVEHARDLAPPSIAARDVAAAKVVSRVSAQRGGGRSVPYSTKAGKAASKSAGSGECASSAGTTASPLQPT
jgi:hypothetical protein